MRVAFALLAVACAAEKPAPKPVRTDLEPPPVASAEAEKNTDTEPVATATAPASDGGAADIARRFIDAANAGDLKAEEALSTPACWKKECASFAEQAQKKFKVQASTSVLVVGRHARVSAKILCGGDRECDAVHVLLEQNGDAWLVSDITENDRKATDWVGSNADPSSSEPNEMVASDSSTGMAANLRQIMARQSSKFRACYNRGLAQDPTASGKVKVTMTIDGTGTVTKVDAAPSGNLPPSVVSCIRSEAQAAKFDPHPGAPITIAVPLVFAKM